MAPQTVTVFDGSACGRGPRHRPVRRPMSRALDRGISATRSDTTDLVLTQGRWAAAQGLHRRIGQGRCIRRRRRRRRSNKRERGHWFEERLARGWHETRHAGAQSRLRSISVKMSGGSPRMLTTLSTTYGSERSSVIRSNRFLAMPVRLPLGSDRRDRSGRQRQVRSRCCTECSAGVIAIRCRSWRRCVGTTSGC